MKAIAWAWLVTFAAAAAVGYGLGHQRGSLLQEALHLIPHDSHVQEHYSAQLADLDAQRTAAQVQVAQAHVATQQAEAEAARHREDKAALEKQIADDAVEDEDREKQLEAEIRADLGERHGKLVADLTAIWQQRVDAERQRATDAVEQSERERKVAAALRVELIDERKLRQLAERELKLARDRAEQLARRRLRLGPGTTCGPRVVPRVEVTRPACVAGISLVWS